MSGLEITGVALAGVSIIQGAPWEVLPIRYHYHQGS